VSNARKSFDQELKSLEDMVVALASQTGEAVADSVEALRRRDLALARKAKQGEEDTDSRRHQIETKCVSLLATQQPMAGDLRRILASLVISIDLERMADHAEGVAAAAERMMAQPPLKPLVDIPRMAEICQDMLKKAMDAFVRKDAKLAAELALQDDDVDGLRSQIFRELLTYMIEDPRNISRALELILVTQHLERMGDHATNLGERIVYMITGELSDLNPSHWDRRAAQDAKAEK
jgi:phosphate transport system protein